MKTKKIVSLVLAIIMLVSVFPMSAIAQGVNNAYATVKGNSYTDANALPDESYQYTVKGPDGRAQTITLLGKNADTGNAVKEIPVFYKRVSNPGSLGTTKRVLILEKDTNFAIKKDLRTPKINGVKNDAKYGDIVEGNQLDFEWDYTLESSTVNLMNRDKMYIEIKDANKGGTKLSENKNNFNIDTNSDYVANGYIKFNDQSGWNWWFYLNISGDDNLLGTDMRYLAHNRGHETASNLKLYTKVVDTDNATMFIVDTTGIEKILADAERIAKYPQSYEPSSYTNFEAACRKAQIALDSVKDTVKVDKFYVTQAEADNAIKVVNDAQVALQNAIAQLKYQFDNGEQVTPKIHWERTFDPYQKGYTGSVLTGVQSVRDDNKTFPIIWEWDKPYDGNRTVRDLIVGDYDGTKVNDPVWDYQKNKQVNTDIKNGKTPASAATWKDLTSDGNKDKNGWTTSSVRRFSGTFTWPHGYTLNDKAIISSVNDKNYQAIYDYINADPDLKARYGKSKVIAVNDNMYVFISKASEQPKDWKTTAEALNHLVFWSGTDGKGIWSMVNSANADAGRTTPIDFNSRSATPAYNKAWPNLEDRPGGSNSNVKSYSKFPNDAKYGVNQNKSTNLEDAMKFSDGWYTLADTSGVMSTLTGLYGSSANLDGEEMRIEVFAFDNAGDGGMDEIQLTLKKPDATDVKVTVDYFLKTDGGKEIDLGLSTYFFATEGAQYKVEPGTLQNELNYGKKEASKVAGEGATVSDGVQQGEIPFVVHRGTADRIKIVYTADKINRTYLTYDFATANKLVYDFGQTYKSVGVETTSDITVAKGEGNNINITYVPDSTKSIGAAATLVVVDSYSETKRIPIYIIPASNVLYEENFIEVEPWLNSSKWVKVGVNSVNMVADNQNTVFGYTDAYKSVRGNNGSWETTLKPSGDKQFSDDLVFNFTGKGFDVIGEVGPHTGTIMVSVRDQTQANKVIKNYLVDTKYSAGTLYQVPLVHCDDLPSGQYTVRISAANINFNAPAARAYSLRPTSINPAAYNAMLKMGLTDEEIEMTEFINMEDVKPVSTYALRNAKAAPAPSAVGDKTVAIDAVRVYRNTNGAEFAYPQNEVGIKYANVTSATDSNFTAYMENNCGKFGVADYNKNGGPANEIYLAHGQAIAIKTAGTNGKAQVSLRAVSDPTTIAMNDVQYTLNHNTEMYYETTLNNGLVVIVNKSESMVAIGNVKSEIASITDNETKTASAMAAKMMAAPIVPEKETFAPARFDVKLDVIKTLFNQYATLKVKTSDDVAYITVNGVRVDANNVNLNKWGIHDYLRFSLRKTFKKNDAILFEVVAYDKNGNASEPVIKK